MKQTGTRVWRIESSGNAEHRRRGSWRVKAAPAAMGDEVSLQPKMRQTLSVHDDFYRAKYLIHGEPFYSV